MENNNLLPDDVMYGDDAHLVYRTDEDDGDDSSSEIEDGDDINEELDDVEDNNIHPEVDEVEPGMVAAADIGSDAESDFNDSDQDNQLPRAQRPNMKRGMTRLPRLRTDYTRSDGRKKLVKFDNLGRFSGKYRALFVSYLGDLVRQKVGLRVFSWKAVETGGKGETMATDHIVMKRMGMLLRNFRRKDLSGRTTEARKSLKYTHRMGRGGYKTLTKKLVANNVIAKDEQPSRSLLWCKGREDKHGDIKPEAKMIADQLMEHEKQIKDGTVLLEPGTDAMTMVFGKDKGGYLKGVGTGVTATTYFHIPRNKGSAKEEIKELKCAVHNGKVELEKKDAQVKDLTTKFDEQQETLNWVLAHLAATGTKIPNLPNTSAIKRTNKKGVQSKSVAAIADKPSLTLTPTTFKNTKKVLAPKTSTITPELAAATSPPNQVHQSTIKTNKKVVSTKNVSEVPATSPSNPVPQTIKCSLCYPDKRNIVARGEIHLSSKRQSIHGVPLQDDCYKVSILEMVENNVQVQKQVLTSAVKEVVKSSVNEVGTSSVRKVGKSSVIPPQENVPQTTNKRKKVARKQTKKTKKPKKTKPALIDEESDDEQTQPPPKQTKAGTSQPNQEAEKDTTFDNLENIKKLTQTPPVPPNTEEEIQKNKEDENPKKNSRN
ncbi:hypothetical protein LXL04_007887 [Taraxacum kok-saghyz]